jgi:hypothetical protein
MQHRAPCSVYHVACSVQRGVVNLVISQRKESRWMKLEKTGGGWRVLASDGGVGWGGRERRRPGREDPLSLASEPPALRAVELCACVKPTVPETVSPEGVVRIVNHIGVPDEVLPQNPTHNGQSSLLFHLLPPPRGRCQIVTKSTTQRPRWRDSNRAPEQTKGGQRVKIERKGVTYALSSRSSHGRSCTSNGFDACFSVCQSGVTHTRVCG